MSETLKEFIKEFKRNEIEKSIDRDEKHIQGVVEHEEIFIDNITDRLDAFYGKYSSKDGLTMVTARKRISEHEYKRFKRRLKKYKKDNNLTEIAKEEMQRNTITVYDSRRDLLNAEINAELIVMTSEQEMMHQDYMVEEIQNDYLLEILTIVAIASFLGRQQGGKNALGRDQKKIDKFIARERKNIPSKEFIRDNIVNRDFLSSRWSERLWSNQEALRNELDTLIRNGIVQGKNPRELAREIRKAFKSSKYNSERLLVTEMSRAQAESQREFFERSGFDEYMYIAESTACPICKKLDGKVFKVKDMEMGKNCHPMHPFCKCSISSYMSREAFERDLEERGL